MKYTICGFQQAELLNLGLDHTDALILRYILDFFNTNKMCQKVHDDKIWFWLSYGTICEEMPILGIKTNKHIAKIMSKWEKSGIIDKMVVKGNDEYILNGKKLSRRGSFTYFTLNPDIMSLLISTPAQKSETPPNGLRKKAQQGGAFSSSPSTQKSETKDSSSTDSLFINNSTNANDEDIKIYFEHNDWQFRSDGFAFHKTYGEKIPVRKFTGMLPMEYVKKIDELYA